MEFDPTPYRPKPPTVPPPIAPPLPRVTLPPRPLDPCRLSPPGTHIIKPGVSSALRLATVEELRAELRRRGEDDGAGVLVPR